MVIVPTITFRRRRKHRRITPPPPPQALTLVSASYADSEWVELTFDRAVDASGFVPGQIAVDDGLISTFKFLANGPVTVVSPTTIQIALVDDGQASAFGILLDASSATGIVAVDDGGTWEGVNGYEIPTS